MIKEEKILEVGIRINKRLKLKIQDENGREILEVEFQRKNWNEDDSMIKEEKNLEVGIRINKRLKLKIQDENGREILEVEFQRKKPEMKMIQW